MASLAGQNFNGSTGFTDSHDTIQSKAGNVTWFNEFAPSGEERIAEVLLWACHSMELCCTIAGECAMERSGKLASRPVSIAIYSAYHPQKWSFVARATHSHVFNRRCRVCICSRMVHTS